MTSRTPKGKKKVPAAVPPSAVKKRPRAKVHLEFPEKLFHEKVLFDWKQSVAEVNHASVIKKAHDNLKRYPLNVAGYHDLRKIKGIGEDIATRLDAAWKYACTNHFIVTIAEQGPSLQEVRNLKPGDSLRFLTTAFVSRGKRVPFLRHPKTTNAAARGSAIQLEENGGNGEEGLQSALDLSNLLDQPWNDDASDGEGTVELLDDDDDGDGGEAPTTSAANAPRLDFNPPSRAVQMPVEVEMLSSDPTQFPQSRLLLIVDSRENSGAVMARGRFSRKPITGHLEKLGVEYELRALSIGDYLWVLQLPQGRGEMVLDYIVERKTWDDLKSSIRGTRYVEQKRRLRQTGIRNVILVAEGAASKDRSLEQALVTTSVDQRFLIHRTTNLQTTAKFLKSVGERLTKRCKVERICGPPFLVLQDDGRKTKTISVSECWLRQLTVCPGMSAEKAQMVCSRYPTFRSLTDLYRSNRRRGGEAVDGAMLLHERIPEIPPTLSSQLYQFFDAC